MLPTFSPVCRGTVTRSLADFRPPENQASVVNDADVLEAINVETFPDGQAVNQQALFGNTIDFDHSGNIIAATAMFQVGHTQSTHHSDRQGETPLFAPGAEVDWCPVLRCSNILSATKTRRVGVDELDGSIGGCPDAGKYTS